MMKQFGRTMLTVIGLAVAALVIAVQLSAQRQTITTFDAPGAVNGTVPYSISPSGTITGFDRDTNWGRHAFLRTSNGTITIIDAPGAGTCSLPCGSVNSGPGTRAYSINPAGTIIGFYSASENGPAHGYARSSDGTFTEIDALDAGTGQFPQGTFPQAINPEGAIAGYYVDSSFVQHGFVRTSDGAITEFDPPNSIYTFPYAINPAGAIEGFYYDTTTGNYRGFMRAADGTITAFDNPSAGSNGNQGQGTFPVGITPSGKVSGSYQDSSNVNHGFVGVLGSFTTFDAPGAGTSGFQGTFVYSSNYSGDITGSYIDASNATHGFVRAKQGTITPFDVLVTGGTVPSGINQSGAITGYYIDASGVTHGFLRSK